MQLGRDAVPALSQTKAANNQGKQNTNFLNSQIPDLTFKTKGQLRRMLEDEWMEKAILKASYEKRIEEMLIEHVRLREKVKELNQEVSYYQDMYIEEVEGRRDKTIKDQIDINYLKIAG
jgi:hypothetical protein